MLKDKLAIVLTALLILTPLAVHPARTLINEYPNADHGDWKKPEIIIGIFTLLVIVFQAWTFRRQADISTRQADIAETQTQVAHTQMMISYRPKVIVRRIEILALNADEPLKVRYTFVNTGGTVANLIEWAVNYIIVPPQPNLTDTIAPLRILTVRPINLTSGASHQEVFTAAAKLGDCCDLIERGNMVLLFFGGITYRDGMGHVKQTAFVRRFDPESGRFRLTDDPDNEYQD